jgi:hypothetical protein
MLKINKLYSTGKAKRYDYDTVGVPFQGGGLLRMLWRVKMEMSNNFEGDIRNLSMIQEKCGINF